MWKVIMWNIIRSVSWTAVDTTSPPGLSSKHCSSLFSTIQVQTFKHLKHTLVSSLLVVPLESSHRILSVNEQCENKGFVFTERKGPDSTAVLNWSRLTINASAPPANAHRKIYSGTNWKWFEYILCVCVWFVPIMCLLTTLCCCCEAQEVYFEELIYRMHFTSSDTSDDSNCFILPLNYRFVFLFFVIYALI